MYLYSSEITDISVSVFRSFRVRPFEESVPSTGRCDGRSVLPTRVRAAGPSDVSAEMMTKRFSYGQEGRKVEDGRTRMWRSRGGKGGEMDRGKCDTETEVEDAARGVVRHGTLVTCIYI